MNYAKPHSLCACYDNCVQYNILSSDEMSSLKKSVEATIDINSAVL
jgi:hypothetical protein